MKTRTLLLTSIALLTFAASVALATDTGPRELASGMIEYEISTTGRGTTMTGTKTEWFADHGRRSATLEKKTTKTDAFGQKSTERTEELSIADGDTVYTIDLVNKTGTKMDVGALKAMGAAMAGKMMADGTLPKNLREFVEKNGGKWLPAEMFLGRKCDVYEVMGVRSWAYKGIILRTESSIAGVVTKEVAKTFEENASVPASRFEVPAGIKFEEPEGMAEAQSLVGGARPDRMRRTARRKTTARPRHCRSRSSSRPWRRCRCPASTGCRRSRPRATTGSFLPTTRIRAGRSWRSARGSGPSSRRRRPGSSLASSTRGTMRSTPGSPIPKARRWPSSS
jgi:hypothetical protein